jgi:hypothetical protein
MTESLEGLELYYQLREWESNRKPRRSIQQGQWHFSRSQSCWIQYWHSRWWKPEGFRWSCEHGWQPNDWKPVDWETHWKLVAWEMYRPRRVKENSACSNKIHSVSMSTSSNIKSESEIVQTMWHFRIWFSLKSLGNNVQHFRLNKQSYIMYNIKTQWQEDRTKHAKIKFGQWHEDSRCE